VTQVTDFVLMQTRGFINEVSDEGNPCVKGLLMAYALRNINPKTNWVVFYPENEIPNLCPKCKHGKPHLEDEGRTLIVPSFKGLTKKVYVILDDFGSPETLKQNMGKYAPPNLNTKYVVTFLLAEEY